MPNSTSPSVFEKSPLRAYSSKGLVVWGLKRTLYHAKLIIRNLSSQLTDFRLPKKYRFYVFRIFVDTLVFQLYSELLFTCVWHQVSKNKGWITTLLLSGVLDVHNNRGLYFLCYYKLPPDRCFLVLLWSLKERSFKTSIAVQRHPHLKIYFFHVVWYFYVSPSQKLSLFS